MCAMYETLGLKVLNLAVLLSRLHYYIIEDGFIHVPTCNYICMYRAQVQTLGRGLVFDLEWGRPCADEGLERDWGCVGLEWGRPCADECGREGMEDCD